MFVTKAVILCGGQGTRIRDVADDIPKPMIRIGERPIVWHIMKLYAHYGVTEFVLCLGYKGWIIKEYFLNYQAITSNFTVTLGQNTAIEYHDRHAESGWKITLLETGYDTQTGGRVWQTQPYVQHDGVFCMTYGDGVADLNIADLLAFHKAHGRIATVTGVRPPGRFGVLGVAEQETLSLVEHFNEKPQTTEGYINGGYFVFDQRLWGYLTGSTDESFEQRPLSRLAADGQLIMYPHEGFWQPMDTYREWRLLNELWHTAHAPWQR